MPRIKWQGFPVLLSPDSSQKEAMSITCYICSYMLAVQKQWILFMTLVLPNSAFSSIHST